jgi:hypothetical protein
VRTFGAGEGAVLVQALSISAPIDNAVFDIADRRVRRDSKIFFTLKTNFPFEVDLSLVESSETLNLVIQLMTPGGVPGGRIIKMDHKDAEIKIPLDGKASQQGCGLV